MIAIAIGNAFWRIVFMNSRSISSLGLKNLVIPIVIDIIRMNISTIGNARTAFVRLVLR